MSQIVNFSLFDFKNVQHLPTYGTSIAFPFGRLTCVLSALPTIDLTVQGTGYTYPPLHSPEDCNVVGVFCFVVCFVFVAFKKPDFQCFFCLDAAWLNVAVVRAVAFLSATNGENVATNVG